MSTFAARLEYRQGQTRSGPLAEAQLQVDQRRETEVLERGRCPWLSRPVPRHHVTGADRRQP